MALRPLPPLGLGLARAGSFNNPVPLSASVALIRAALDLGVTLLDTANIYGQGDSERVIGRALAGQRERAFIVTKGGQTFSTKIRLLRPLKPLLRTWLARRDINRITAARTGAMRSDWSEAGLTASLDGSLRRLGTTQVDAFLLHSPPAEILRRPETSRVLADIAASGKAVRVGVACDNLTALDTALDLPRLDLLELPWDVLAAIRTDRRATVIRARGVAVIAREVLRFQPALPAAAAFAAARAHPLVSTTLIGSRRLDRVQALALNEESA